MGLLKLFTNPAGFAKDKFMDKIMDKKDGGGTPGSNIMDKFQGLQDRIQSKTDIVGSKADEIREQALGGSDVRSLLLERAQGIAGRELPQVQDYKPAGKAAEWMNRLGAGLYAAGGGNPEDIYANFRNKELVKQERHQRQTENRQQAIEQQDSDILNVLSGLDQRETTAATQVATNLTNQETSLQNAATQAGLAALDTEASNARQMVTIQSNWASDRQGHVDRLQELNVQGELNMAQINESAAIQMRNEMNSEMLTLGMNPASIQRTVDAYAHGDFENMTAQDHVRLSMIGKMKSAQTDEDLRMVKLETMAQVMNTRVHARDEATGAFLFGPTGDPVYTTLATPEATAKWVFGSKQDALDSFRSGAVSSETAGLEEFLQSAGQIDPSAAVQQGRSAFTDNTQGGFPGTEESTFQDVESDPRAAKQQLGQAADIWTHSVSFLDSGVPLKDVLQQMKNDKMSPEIMQMVIQRSMEFGYWDGQEDMDSIQQIITLGAPQPGTGGVQ